MTNRCLKCGLEIRKNKPVYVLFKGEIANDKTGECSFSLGKELYLCEDCLKEIQHPDSVPIISLYRDDVAKYIGTEKAEVLTTEEMTEISEHVGCGYLDEVYNESLRDALVHLDYVIVTEQEADSV